MNATQSFIGGYQKEHEKKKNKPSQDNMEEGDVNQQDQDELETYMLVCGNIQDIQSVFLTAKALESDADDDHLNDKAKRTTTIPAKYLVPLSIFLENSIFKRLLNQDVLDRILKAFNIEYSLATASINQYQFIALNAFLRFSTLTES